MRVSIRKLKITSRELTQGQGPSELPCFPMLKYATERAGIRI